MALFFHSDDVDRLIPFNEAVQITEHALRDLVAPQGVNAPRKRLNLHYDVGEGSFDTVLDICAGGKAAGRTSDSQIILYKNQGGQGIVDITLAKRCYDLAKQSGKGYELNIAPRLNWWVQGGRADAW